MLERFFGKKLQTTSEPSNKMKRAEATGLDPNSSTWGEIEAAESEPYRQKRVAELGLSPSANFKEIRHAENEQRRMELVAEYGLPPSATWADISAEKKKKRFPKAA